MWVYVYLCVDSCEDLCSKSDRMCLINYDFYVCGGLCVCVCVGVSECVLVCVAMLVCFCE